MDKNTITIYISSVILTISLFTLIYDEHVVEFSFLFFNFVVLLITLPSLFWFLKHSKLSSAQFSRKLVALSAIVRICTLIILVVIWKQLTNTLFSVDGVDSVSFHRKGMHVAQMIQDSDYQFLKYLHHFDDAGYPILMGILYSLTDNSIVLMRLIQVSVSVWTIFLLYKSVGSIIDEITARYSAIILVFTLPISFYVGVHLKETFMLYFIALAYFSAIGIVMSKRIVKSLIYLLVALIGLLLFRFVLFAIILVSVVVFLLMYKNHSSKLMGISIRNVFIIVVGLGLGYLILNQSSLLQDTSSKYDETVNNNRGGGRRSNFEAKSVNLTNAIVSLPSAIITPFPSITKTNMGGGLNTSVTEQWLHIGGLSVWGALVYYFFIGVYVVLKRKRYKDFLLFGLSTGAYMFVLTASFYVTSIRFNIPKMFMMIPIMAYGLAHCPPRLHKYWIVYCIFFCFLLFFWNYVKLSSWGLI